MIDTTTADGRLMFGIFAALAELERELIVGKRGQALLRREPEASTVAGHSR